MINKFNPDKVKHIKTINWILRLFYHEKKSKSKPDITGVDSILIIDPTRIGDIVMLTPLLRAIRNGNNYCSISLVCGKWAKSILDDQGLVDEFIVIDTDFLNSVKKLIFDRKKLKKQIKRVNTKIYSYAIEPRGDLRYIYFMHYCSAKRKVSYNYTGGECFLTDVIVPSANANHLVEDKLFFIKSIGGQCNEKDIYPRLILSGTQIEIKNNFLKKRNLADKIVIGIHPGASLKIKEWKGFDKVLVKVNQKINNCFFIIFKGPNEEEAVERVEKAAINCGASYAVSSTSIMEYMARISACRLMLCNDSGAGHIAAAYGIPTVVIFGPVIPEISRPYAKDNVICFSEELNCKPCMSRECMNNSECMRSIDGDKVSNAVLRIVLQER